MRLASSRDPGSDGRQRSRSASPRSPQIASPPSTIACFIAASAPCITSTTVSPVEQWATPMLAVRSQSVIAHADFALPDLRSQSLGDGQGIYLVRARKQDGEQAVFEFTSFIHVAGDCFEKPPEHAMQKGLRVGSKPRNQLFALVDSQHNDGNGRSAAFPFGHASLQIGDEQRSAGQHRSLAILFGCLDRVLGVDAADDAAEQSRGVTVWRRCLDRRA